MKRFLCLFCLFVLLPVLSFAEAPGLLSAYKMVFDAQFYNNHYNADFEYDMLAIDLYLMDDHTTVYYQRSAWSGDNFESTGLVRGYAEYSDKIYTVSFKNGFSFKFYREGSNIWINMDGGSFLLKRCEDFSLSTDFKAENL